MTTWEGEAASASVYYEAHTFLLVPANTENKFSDNSVNTSPSYLHSSEPTKTLQQSICFLLQMLCVFPYVQQLDKSKRKDLQWLCKNGQNEMVTTQKRFQNKTRKSQTGHGCTKKFSSLQKEGKKNLWLMLPCSSLTFKLHPAIPWYYKSVTS